tara:strand:+ start:5397 stop:5699 length:303 start_codon:yes stop_codon:yes gene_type:complete
MSGVKLKKKPTAREIGESIIELSNRTNYLFDLFKELERAFSIYIEMKGDTQSFTDFVNKKIEEWKKLDDEKRNGNTDKQDIPKDSGHKGAGTEGVRKETK